MSEKDVGLDVFSHPQKAHIPPLDAVSRESVWPFDVNSKAKHNQDKTSFKLSSTKVEVTNNKTAELTYSDGRKRLLEFDGSVLTKVTEPDGQTWARVGNKDEWIISGKEHWLGHIHADSHEINYAGLDGYTKWSGHNGAQGLEAQIVSICDLKDEYQKVYVLLNRNGNDTLEKEELSNAFSDKSLTAKQAQVIAALYENFDSLSRVYNDDNGKDAGISTSDITTFDQNIMNSVEHQIEHQFNATMLDAFAGHEFGFEAADSKIKDGYLTIDEISDYLKRYDQPRASSDNTNGIDRTTKPLTVEKTKPHPLEVLRVNFDQIKNAFDEKSPDSSKGISQKDIETYTKQTLTKDIQLADNLALSLKLTRRDLVHGQGKLSLSELQDLRDKLQFDLTKQYAVTFSKDDGSASYLIRRSAPDKTNKTNDEYTPELPTRAPKWFELDALGHALARSQPSYVINERKESIKFHFLKSPISDQTNVLALVSQDKDGRPAVYYSPNYLRGTATIKEARLAHFDIRRSLEYTTIHELTHNSQRRLGWAPLNLLEVATATQMGWKFIESGNYGGWVLQGKDKNLYQHLDYLSWDKWKNQKDLESFSKRTMYDVIKTDKDLPYTTVNWQEVSDHVQVKPITEYFDNPKEMHAEGLTYFRLGTDYRAALAEKSPTLYNIVKSHDQAEINLAYPPASDGRARFIRGTHGFLVPNTAENQRNVSDFEHKHLTIIDQATRNSKQTRIRNSIRRRYF